MINIFPFGYFTWFQNGFTRIEVCTQYSLNEFKVNGSAGFRKVYDSEKC